MFIDRAFLLTTSTDRAFLKRKCAHIERYLMLPKGFVEVWHNDRDNEDPKRGCFNAHFAVYEFIAKHEISCCLILEDDVHFLKPIPESIYVPFLEEHEWDAFYFGHKPDFRQDTYVKRTNHSGVIQVRTNDRHAYLMHLQFAKVMASKPWSGVFGDRLLRSSTDKAYALVPMRAIQSGSLFSVSHYNGITEKFSEYLRMMNQNPFSWSDGIRYSLLLIFGMPVVAVRFTLLALIKTIKSGS